MSNPSNDPVLMVEILDITVTTSSPRLKSIDVSINNLKQSTSSASPGNHRQISLAEPSILSSNPIIIHLNYKLSVLLNRSYPSNIKITRGELLEGVTHDSLGKQEWRKVYGAIEVTIGLKLVSSNVSNPANPAGLQPTTDAIFEVCDRFRVLVIGKTGAGKSSLINECFGVTDANVSAQAAGKSDINKEIFSPTENERFVLHDSQGFEPGEGHNWQTAINFLQTRKQGKDIKNQIHAVWLCVAVPVAGDRLFETGVEELLRMFSKKELGPMPLIVIFTKYDKLVDYIEFSTEFSKLAGQLDDKSLREALDKESQAQLQERCIHPLKEMAGDGVPYITVSTEENYKDTLVGLVQMTTTHVKQYLGVEEVTIVSRIAQQVDPGDKLEALIAIGKKRYWQSLGSSASFTNSTLENCLDILHIDIVRVWNMQDKKRLLNSEEFKKWMVKIVSEEGALPNPKTTILTSLPVFGTMAGIIGALAGPAAPIVVPIVMGVGLVGVAVVWTREVYKGSQIILRRLMAYIIDLTLILQLTFTLVTNTKLQVTCRLIKLAVKTYIDSGTKAYVHDQVNNYAKGANLLDREGACMEISKMIQGHRMMDDGMAGMVKDSLKGFENTDDESW